MISNAKKSTTFISLQQNSSTETSAITIWQLHLALRGFLELNLELGGNRVQEGTKDSTHRV